MCTKFQVAILKKTAEFCRAEYQKGHFLWYLREIQHFPVIFFSILVVLGFYGHFCVLDENLNKQDVSHHHFFNVTFLTSSPSMALIWHKVTKGLEGYLLFVT